MKEELIETTNLLKEDVLDYVNTRIEIQQWLLVEKGAHFITKIMIFFLGLMISGTVFFFLSFALAFYLGEKADNFVLGFAIVAGIYLVLGLIIYAFRRFFIERPIVSTMADLVFRHESKIFDHE